jgi:protein-disulfide isomerase
MNRTLIQALAATIMIFLSAALGTASERAEPRVPIDISGHPYRGPVNAPVTVVVFSDYL